MASDLPHHPPSVDPPPKVGWNRARTRAGLGIALLVHLGPSGLTVLLMPVAGYASAGTTESLLEGGVFLLVMVLLIVAVLQGGLALGCLIAVAVTWSRGDPGFALGLAVGWFAGAVLAVVGGWAGGYVLASVV